MKKYLKFSAMFCALAIVTVIGAGNAQAQKLKIATVDIQKLFDGYYRTAEQNQKFSEEFARIQKEGNERLTGIRALEETLVKLKKKIEDPTLSENVRKDAEIEFRKKFDDVKSMRTERGEFLGRRDRALKVRKQASLKATLEEIRKHIIDYSKSEDVDFVFDKSAVNLGTLLYSKDSTDITPVILKMINKDAPAAPTEPAAPAGQ